MKVGDIVKLKASGKFGLVTDRIRRTEADGNPNGDFVVYYVHRVQLGEQSVVIKRNSSVEVINESR
jgi:hypothetical protein